MPQDTASLAPRHNPGGAWSQPPEAVLAALDSRAEGLSPAEARRRLGAVGPNAVVAGEGASPWRLLLRQVSNPLVLILLFACAIAAGTRQWVDAGMIFTIVLGSTLLGFAQEHRASRAIAALRKRLALTAQVRRGGHLRRVPVAELVPGDVIELTAGSLIPADARLLQVNGLLVNEAALTGESFPAEKGLDLAAANAGVSARRNCVFLGSAVQSGHAVAVVTETGHATQFGAIAERLKARPPESDFQRSVRRFGGLLMRVMIVVVLAVLTVNQLLGRPFLDSLLFALALGVGLSPELLPAIISVTLSAGARRLAASGVIVRRLEAIEDLGAMTVFCTDKTGTLTDGRIRLEAAVGPTGAPDAQTLRLAYLNAAFSSGVANPLDQATRAAGEAAGLTLKGATKIAEVPYDFSRRRLSVAMRIGKAGGGLLVTKGAVDSVLPLCARVVTAAGTIGFGASQRAAVAAFAQAQGEQGLRLLAVASRKHSGAGASIADEADLTLQGFVVFLDPPKADAAATLSALRGLGVTVKVVSGDNRHVVRHVAEAVGLGSDHLLTGGDIARLTDAALQARAERTNLFAEVDPQQKERIIRALQRRGHAVGYLGDGVNDAPALHAADVGISVDHAVDVARESADVVLLHRDLEVLRSGIEGGRRTFANTLKYICISCASNFGNMVSMALASPLLPFLPMTAQQILLNNLLADLPSVAISSDRVDPARLAQAQRMGIGEIQRFMLLFGLISSAFDIATFVLLLRGVHASPAEFRTAWFTESLLTQLSALMLLRTQGPAWRSRPAPVVALSAALVAVLALSLPLTGPLARLFGFTPLPPGLLGLILLLVAGYAAATETAKLRFFAGARPATGLTAVKAQRPHPRKVRT